MLTSDPFVAGFARPGEQASVQQEVPVKRAVDYLSLMRSGALVLVDFLSLCLLQLLTYVTLALVGGNYNEVLQSGWSRFVTISSANSLIAVLVGVLLLTKGHYTERPSFWCEARRLVAAGGLASSMLIFWPLSGVDLLSRIVVAGWWLLLPAWVMVFRQKLREALSRAEWWRLRVVVVAPGDAMEQVERTLNSRRPPDFNIVRGVNVDLINPDTNHDWKAILAQHHAQQLIIAASPGAPGYDRLLKSIVRSRISFMLVVDNGELPVFGMHDTRALRSDAVLVSYRTGLSRPVTRWLKMAIDLSLATLLLLFLAPLMTCLSVLVAMDGGPVLFAHERVGEGGRRFRCLKFRTMAVNGDEILAQTLATDPVAVAEWRETRKLLKDPRVTRVGRFLRKTSLDELPQLFNVLRRHMSLVGPRPIVQEEISRYAEDIAFYYEARPGLTGLWQVSGRSDTSYEQRVAYDRWYVKNWTLWHDFVILMMTLPTVMARKGAR